MAYVRREVVGNRVRAGRFVLLRRAAVVSAVPLRRSALLVEAALAMRRAGIRICDKFILQIIVMIVKGGRRSTSVVKSSYGICRGGHVLKSKKV